MAGLDEKFNEAVVSNLAHFRIPKFLPSKRTAKLFERA
jgi:hypothetical protein